MKNTTNRKQGIITLPIIVLGLLLFFPTGNLAQTLNRNIREYEGFQNGTTYFIKTGDESIDSNFQKVAKTYWNINDYEFIDFQQIESTNSEENFFAGLFKSEVYYTKGSGAQILDRIEYQLLLFKNPKIKKDELSNKDNLATIELTYDDDNEPYRNANLIYSLQYLQEELHFTFERNKKSDPKFHKIVKERRAEKAALVNDKVLYVQQKDLKKRVDTEAEISEFYGHRFKFVHQNDIDEAIENQEEDVAYVRLMWWGGMKYALVLTAKDNQMLYAYGTAMIDGYRLGPGFFKGIK